jgi:hypothetical protein
VEALLNRCGLKVNASSDHLNRLNASGERFFKDKTHGGFQVDGKPNAESTKYLFTIEGVPDYPSAEWGVVVGDAVHCLRSALDQLAYGLAAAPSRATQFPVCRSRRDWVTKAPAMCWSIPPAYVAVLDAVQPYHRGDKANVHPVAVINALSNLDKHESIPATALVPANTEWDVTKTDGIATWTPLHFFEGRALEPGAVIAESNIVPDNSGIEPKMNVELFTLFDIGFGTIKRAPSITHKPVIKTFNDLLGPFVIEDVLLAVLDAYRTG